MRRFSTFCVLALSLLLASCKPEIDFVSYRSAQAEVSPAGGDLSMIFSSEAGSASVELEASKAWTASFVNSRAKDWCSLSLESGKRGTATLTVSVKENPDYDQRSASINFVCGDVERTLVVTQKQKDALLVTSNRVEVGQPGGGILVEVKANISFDYVISEGAKSWIKPVGTKGLVSSVLQFEVSANDSVEKREGEITVTGSAGKEVVKVYQAGETPTLVISSSLEELAPKTSEFVVEVRSNLDVTVEIPVACDWLQEVGTKSVSTNSFYFVAEKNHHRQARASWIAFHNKTWGVSDTVHVTQDFQRIVVSSDTLRASTRGWTVSFETADPDPSAFKLIFSDRWLYRAGEEGLQQESRFFVAAQPVTDLNGSRLGSVRVYYQDFAEPDTVWIRQYGRLPAFSYTTTATRVRVPEVEEEGQVGFVFWGDDTQESWQPALTHTYKSSGLHTVTVEVLNKKQVPITGVEDGMTINLRELRK